MPSGRGGALSPLNPKARVTSGLSTGNVTGQAAGMAENGSSTTSALGTHAGQSVLGGGLQAQRVVNARRPTSERKI